MTFVLPTLIWNANNEIGTTGDSRGGDTDVVLQLRSILAYPLQYIKLFFKKVISEFGRYFAGTAGLACFGRDERTLLQVELYSGSLDLWYDLPFQKGRLPGNGKEI